MLARLRRFLGFLIASACAANLAAGSVCAQDFPSRPLTMVVPNPAGTPIDLLGRLMAAEMSKVLGQPFVTENKPGANQAIAYEYVARQPADGHTVAIVYTTALVTLPILSKNLRFDPLADLAPVVAVAEDRLALWTSSKYPWKTFDELVKHARANPGKLNYGSPSGGIRLTTEALIRAPGLGLDIVDIPYKGSAPYFLAIASGEVHMGMGAIQAAFASGDRVRVLAVTGTSRLASLPDVPTFAELGYPYMPGINYLLSAHAGTPKPLMNKLYEVASRALQQPEVKTRFATLGLEAYRDNTPDTAAKNLAEEARVLAEIAKKIGVKPE